LSGTVKHEKSVSVPVGTGAGKANIVVQRDVTVTSGAPLTIDLTSVADVSGTVQAFAVMTHWAVENLSNNVGEDFTAGGGANPVIAADPETIQAVGGHTYKACPGAGRPVAGGTKNFQLSVATGVNVPGRLTIIGRTA